MNKYGKFPKPRLKGVARVSIQTLAKKAKLSEEQVEEALQFLEGKGLVTRKGPNEFILTPDGKGA